jgi:uncharacterized protein YbaR (Trm112 family)
MFVDLIDALRCPHPHEDSWLVAAAHETRERVIVAGALGCPVCGREYPIADGVATFDAAPARAPAPAPRLPASRADADDEAMRLAALLGLTSSGGIVAAGGTWDVAADALLALSDVRLLLVDPAHPFTPREPLGAARGAWMPLATGQVRGIALDEGTAEPARLADAVRALRPAGRLLAPVTAPLPDGVRELARDDRHWVAERTAAATGPIVALRRAR